MKIYESKDAFQKECYRLYQLDWMKMHGHSIADIDNDIEENGFSGELWVCLDEFLNSEFKDSDYMLKLFDHMPNAYDLRCAYQKFGDVVHAKEYAACIIDIFEDFLAEKNVSVDNAEHENLKDEAIIYGSDFDFLIGEIVKVIKVLCRDFDIEVDTEHWAY